MHPDEEPMAVYDDAIHTLNSVRKRTTSLYPGVADTLRTLRRNGVAVVAYTESIAFWTEWRIKLTGLDGIIDVLYSSPDHDLPQGVTFEDLRTRPADEYGLKATIHKHAPAGALKPDPRVLKKILADYGIDPRQAVYVGDSLMKDVAMAQHTGTLDVYARYGAAHDRSEYELLRRVSHWREEDIDRERALAEASDIAPSYTLENGFAEILDLFCFSGCSNGG
jgi:phosphoglycolate phosphatase